jgi:hypothetical protein
MTDRVGFKYTEEDSDVVLKVTTLSPTKWLLLDRETGQLYQGNPGGYWDRLDPVIKEIDKK